MSNPKKRKLSRQELTEKHSILNDSIFRLKIFLLTGKRVFRNIIRPTKKFTDNKKLLNEPVIAFSESELWNPFDNKENWILTAGKIENLRISAKKLNGLEVRAHEVFSFWRHIGNPNIGQGYVVGREIREGCIVPTIAGGLCQLSNALYDAALKANFKIIERHKHTKVIKGSLAEQDRDATVKWNYVDLRFSSSFDFRIEAELSSDKLIVSFKSKQKSEKSINSDFALRGSSKLNDCYSCGNFACFKHPDRTSKKQEISTTTFILDEKWPEFDRYVQSIVRPKDSFVVPLKKNRFLKSDRYSWTALNSNKSSQTLFQGVYRAIKLRLASKAKNNVFELMLQLDRKIAIAAAKKIPVDSTHLVISQNVLPFLYEIGVLGGRTFDVLMTRLPFEKIHERLDYAYSKHNESLTLKDFRVSPYLIDLEKKALTKARKIISPHSEIAELFKNKIERLEWKLQIAKNKKTTGSKVLFPASALGRKGAYEMRQITEELNLNLAVSGRVIESPNFWEDVKSEPFNGEYADIGLIVYPTYIENQPRQVLSAISNGIPVITTKACGIERQANVKVLELENMEGIKNEIKKVLSTTKAMDQS